MRNVVACSCWQVFPNSTGIQRAPVTALLLRMHRVHSQGSIPPDFKLEYFLGTNVKEQALCRWEQRNRRGLPGLAEYRLVKRGMHPSNKYTVSWFKLEIQIYC